MAYNFRIHSRILANARRFTSKSYVHCQLRLSTSHVRVRPDHSSCVRSYSNVITTMQRREGDGPALDIPKLSPNSFVKLLNDKGISRVFWISNPNERGVICSHPDFAEAPSIFSLDDRDYNDHEGVFLQVGKRTNALLGAFVWRSNRGQAVSSVVIILTNLGLL